MRGARKPCGKYGRCSDHGSAGTGLLKRGGEVVVVLPGGSDGGDERLLNWERSRSGC